MQNKLLLMRLSFHYHTVTSLKFAILLENLTF